MATRNNAIRNTRTTRTARTAWKVTEKAAVGLARWATTDHTGTAKFLGNMPAMGFIDTITMILMLIGTTILGALVSGLLFYLLFAFGIPFLLGI